MSVPSDILRALDNAVRDDIHTLRDTYFWWLVACAIAVAIGVAMEAPEVIKDIREKFSAYRPGATAEKLIVSVSAIGWFLVAAGVGGEFVFEALVSKVDTTAQSFESILLDDAQVRAGDSIERATRLEHDNLLLRKEIQPRDLTEAEQNSITTGIRGLSFQIPPLVFLRREFPGGNGSLIRIGTYISDAESRRLATVLSSALRKARFDTVIDPIRLEAAPDAALIEGVILTVPPRSPERAKGIDLEKLLNLARVVSGVLTDAGIKSAIKRDENSPLITVGVKPFTQ